MRAQLLKYAYYYAESVGKLTAQIKLIFEHYRVRLESVGIDSYDRFYDRLQKMLSKGMLRGRTAETDDLPIRRHCVHANGEPITESDPIPTLQSLSRRGKLQDIWCRV
jgi:hypothetical protein